MHKYYNLLFLLMLFHLLCSCMDTTSRQLVGTWQRTERLTVASLASIEQQQLEFNIDTIQLDLDGSFHGNFSEILSMPSVANVKWSFSSKTSKLKLDYVSMLSPLLSEESPRFDTISRQFILKIAPSGSTCFYEEHSDVESNEIYTHRLSLRRLSMNLWGI